MPPTSRDLQPHQVLTLAWRYPRDWDSVEARHNADFLDRLHRCSAVMVRQWLSNMHSLLWWGELAPREPTE